MLIAGEYMFRVDQLPVFCDYFLKILPDVLLQLGAVKQCCWMISRHEPDIALLEPTAPKPADPLIGLQDGLGCTASQQNHDLGLQQMHLHPQIRQTGPDLFPIGSAVAGRSALYYIENKNMLKPLKTAGCQNLVQQLSRTADKGSAQPILICTRSLSAEKEFRLWIAFAKNNLTASSPQGAALTGLNYFSQPLQISRFSQPS